MANTKHCLVVELPGETPRHYLLSAKTITIGRSDDNAVILEVDTVSGRHCELRRKDNGYEIVDLGSTNGTKLNTTRIESEPERLRDGDTIRIGLDVKARFYRITEIMESDAKEGTVNGAVTRKLKSQKSPAMPTINPVAAAVARAAKGK